MTRAGYIAVLAALGAVACSGKPVNDFGPGGNGYPVDVDLTEQHQRMDGFGASSAWTTPDMSDAQGEAFFSTETGLGLSLLRIQIRPDGMTSELATAKKAVARGAAVWAAPWSPPGAWKDKGTTRYGGSLLPERRQDWADRLATFVQSMAAEGVPLAGLSAQNEPDYTADWETCIYSPAQLVTFVRDFLGPALAARGLNVPIIAPETQNWTNLSDYANPLLGDPAAAAFVGPVAMHHYGGTPFVYGTAQAANKQLWQTEVSDRVEEIDTGMGSALRVAFTIHEDLVKGGVSAWHYWWLNPRGDVPTGNSALTQGGQLTRRAWALANWSRFVRPGFVRVEATSLPRPYVVASAFWEPASGRIVVVIVNQGPTISQTFNVRGGSVAEVTPWLTSEDVTLASQSPVTVVDGQFSYMLPARSVISFVGTAS